MRVVAALLLCLSAANGRRLLQQRQEAGHDEQKIEERRDLQAGAPANSTRTLISLEEQELRNITSISSMFMIVIRFMGQIAFEPEHNPTAALRCEIFARITLPGLIAATNNAPPRTKMKIVLINSSAVLEPTCARVVLKAKNQLGRRLYFSASNATYMEHTDMSHDLLFFARLDTDDRCGCVRVYTGLTRREGALPSDVHAPPPPLTHRHIF